MKSLLPPLQLIAVLIFVPLADAQNKIIIKTDSDQATAVSFDELFEPGKLWSCTDATLEKTWKGKGLQWMSAQVKDRGLIRRDNSGSQQMKLTAFDGTRTIEEVSFLLKGGKLNEVQIAVWNKGDSKNAEISEKDFTALVEGWSTELNKRIAPKFEDRGKDSASAAKAERRMWMGKETMAQLEYSGGKEKVRDPYTGRERSGQNFQGEFIRLRLMPKPASTVGLNSGGAAGASVKRADLAKSVVREASGDVFIPNIPMVDQGDKGYCAVATASRMFNFYGVAADQHEMAQIAGNSAGGGGTNPDELEEALRKISGKYNTRFVTLLDLE